jgi:exopolysaccharide production protein ExoZ
MRQMHADRKVAYIQAARAFAALAVCVAHLTREFTLKFGLPGFLPFVHIGEAGVDVFFVISGFVIVVSSSSLFNDTPHGARTFMVRRLVRIVPLYWFAATILIVWVVFARGGLSAVNWPAPIVVANYFFLPLRYPDGALVPFLGVAWTLFYEMLFYCLFAAAMLSSSRSRTIVVTSIALCALIGAGYLFTLPAPFAYWSNSITLEFVFGMLLAMIYLHGSRLRFVPAILLGVFGLVAIVLSETLLKEDVYLPRLILLGLPAAMIVAAAALGPAPRTSGLVWAVILFFGEASYALYLMHPFAITLPRYFGVTKDGAAAYPYIYSMLMVVSALIIAALTHVLVERPALKFLRSGTAPAPVRVATS